MKKANVVPGHKKCQTIYSKLPAISLLPIRGKIFARLLYNEMFDFIIINYTDFFYKQLGSGLSPKSCLYFQGFGRSKLLNDCLVA